jgi:hypothetical protein
MRDDEWLKLKLEEIWQTHFGEIAKANFVEIKFGRSSVRRLASIKQKSRLDKNSDSQITVTALFRNIEVPDFVIEATIAHEICHYVHGFASPLPKSFRHPHLGNIVDYELIKRGLGDKLLLQKRWLRENWQKHIATSPIRKKRRRAVKRRLSTLEKAVVRLSRLIFPV